MVQLDCQSCHPELVVVNVGGDGVPSCVLGTVRKHETRTGWFRRAKTAGAHLVVPGCEGRAVPGPVDIVCVAAADPGAWSHVRRHTIPDVQNT